MPRFNFTFQEASPLISYMGFWTEGSPQNDSFAGRYEGSFRVTNGSGAQAMLNFDGTGISLFGALRPNHGEYSVNLDLRAQQSRNGNGNNVFRVALWEAYDLPYQTHTVQLTNQPLGTGPYFDLDFVQIEREVGGEADTIHQAHLGDSSPFVQYSNETWQTTDTAHQTNSSNSKITLTFQGCSIELYGLYTNAGYEVSLDSEAPISMHGMDVTLDMDMWHPNTLLYLMDGLAEDTNHTVTLNTLGSTSDERPFFFDKAIVRSTQNFTQGTPFLSSPDESIETSSPPVALIAGFSVGGVILLVLFVTAAILFRRRQRNRKRLPLDLIAGAEPYNTSPPVPWVMLDNSRNPPSTWQFSSVVSGWHRLSRDGETESGIVRSPPAHSLSQHNLVTTSGHQTFHPVSIPPGQSQFTIANQTDSEEHDVFQSPTLISSGHWSKAREAVHHLSRVDDAPPVYDQGWA